MHAKTPKMTSKKGPGKRPRPSATGAMCLGLLLFVAASGAAQTAVDYYNNGSEALVAGDLPRAVENFREAVRINNAYFDAYTGLAEAYYLLDEYDEALANVLEAVRLSRRNADVYVLQARILLGLGDLPGARDALDNALNLRPNDAAARLTQAEIALAEGQVEAAEDGFLEALRLNPGGRQALLSLMILYDTIGEGERAERYLDPALRNYADSPLVQYLAATHYLGTGNLTTAMRHVQTAVALEPDYRDALLLLGALYYYQERYSEAEAVMDQLLTQNPQDIEAWYVRSVSQEAQGRVGDAVMGYRRALRVSPDFEAARLAMEAAILDNLDLEDDRRAEPAAYRFDRAALFAEQNLFSRALTEYRRGLRLDPYSAEGRMGYAELYRTGGRFATFLAQAEVIRSLGMETTEVSDIIEIYESLLADSVSVEWGIDQFSLPRRPLQISMFYEESGFSLGLPESSRFFAGFAHDLVLGLENLEPAEVPAAVGGYGEAFRLSRGDESDYFVILSFEDQDRSFRGQAGVYLTRTGAEVAEFVAGRSGNDRVQGVLTTLVEEIEALAPVSAQLVARELDRGVIALGAADGVEEGDTFPIVAETAYLLARDGLSFVYSQDDVRGNFEVTQTDDLISEGQITSTDFFDTISIGDLVLTGGQEPVERPAAGLFPPIYHRIRAVR